MNLEILDMYFHHPTETLILNFQSWLLHYKGATGKNFAIGTAATTHHPRCSLSTCTFCSRHTRATIQYSRSATPEAFVSPSSVCVRKPTRTYKITKANYQDTLRATLCERTVEIARMAPSEVDIEAAVMPISTQHPIQVGICSDHRRSRNRSPFQEKNRGGRGRLNMSTSKISLVTVGLRGFRHMYDYFFI